MKAEEHGGLTLVHHGRTEAPRLDREKGVEAAGVEPKERRWRGHAWGVAEEKFRDTI